MPIPALIVRAIFSKVARSALSPDAKDKPMKGQFGVTVEKGANWEKEMRRLGATPEKIHNVVRDELLTTAVHIRSHIVRSMRQTPKTGNLYRKTKDPSVLHRASSPGYPPAVDTTDLLKSIKMDVRRGGVITDYEVEVGSNLTGKNGKYPSFLEFGTSKMDARPWLEPAVMAGERLFYATIRRRVWNSIKR